MFLCSVLTALPGLFSINSPQGCVTGTSAPEVTPSLCVITVPAHTHNPNAWHFIRQFFFLFDRNEFKGFNGDLFDLDIL